MHGRLKVKTTAQQEAEKKKERAVKLGGWSAVLRMTVVLMMTVVPITPTFFLRGWYIE